MRSQVLLGPYCVPSMVIGTEGAVMNKRGKEAQRAYTCKQTRLFQGMRGWPLWRKLRQDDAADGDQREVQGDREIVKTASPRM